MNTAADLIIDIGEISVESASPEDAARLRAVIERALAEAARSLAGLTAGTGALGDLRLDLGGVRDLLAPGAEAALARWLEIAIRAAWEAAR
ncbi:hypothetical protein HYQ43_21995 (plasmid) [Paracoccus pantotrophus]|uniref:Uncharacterized protein n=1 Tax=Paracoccus pantotrophus TaxID=82367 RepID=A0A7H9BZR9_PARPN|nr:hypothetical protein [Paracoccus pantotrophus]QLH16884.1 hypothetical protein HYQ43_21995 [Paracoccus pantotrophus]